MTGYVTETLMAIGSHCKTWESVLSHTIERELGFQTENLGYNSEQPLAGIMKLNKVCLVAGRVRTFLERAFLRELAWFIF